MTQPIIINEAVWPKAGCIMVVFPDQENRDRFMKANFKFLINNIEMVKGRVFNFLSSDPSLQPSVYSDNDEHRVFVDIIDAPGLSKEERANLPEWTRFCTPLNKDAKCELVVLEYDKIICSIQMSKFSRRTREYHGLPEDY